MLINAFNPSLDDLERTFLAQSYSVGTTAVQVKNNQRLSSNDRLLIGEMGLSQSEIVTAGSPNADGTTLPVSSTLFQHPANSPVYQLQFDQVKFYRSTSGSNGSYSPLATVNLDVTAADLQTTYNDETAQVGYYYKVSMFNSASLVESALSDPIAGVTGWSLNQVGYLVDQIYAEIADPDESLLSRDELFGYFNDVNDDLQLQAARPYRFLHSRQVLDRTANINYLAFPTDSSGNQLLWKFDRLDYRFVDTTTNPTTDQTYTLDVLDLEYFRNRYQDNTISAITTSDQPLAVALNDTTNQFVFHPPFATTSTYGCFYLYYWKFLNRITTEAQTFETYSPHIYKLYALMKFYRKRSITEPAYLQLATIYTQDYNAEKARYKSHDRQDQGTARRFVKQTSTYRRYQR